MHQEGYGVMPELPVKIDRTRRKPIGVLAAAGAATLLPFAPGFAQIGDSIESMRPAVIACAHELR